MTTLVKLLKLNNGEDIIAAITEIESGYVIIQNPIRLCYTFDDENEEGVSFLKWIPFTQDNEIQINLDTVVTMVNISEEMKNFYANILAEGNASDTTKDLPDPLNVIN